MRNISFGQDHQFPLDKLIRNIRYRIVSPHIKTNSLVLDLGCGYDAKLLKNISSKIKNGVGLDISVSEKKPSKNISLIKAAVDKKLPFPNNKFDIVIALAIIEHVESPQTLLSESFRVLKNGGILLLTTPDEKAKTLLEFLAFKLRVISQKEIKDHKKYYTESSLYKELTKAGFEKVKIIITSFELELNLFVKAIK